MIRETSPETCNYNCIAWAVGDDTRWWWPHQTSYWPDNVTNTEELSSFVELFRDFGYEVCPDGNFEARYVKVAIYCDENDMPTHATRQLPNGYWTSKLGPSIDVEHYLDDLTAIPDLARCYGQIKVFMKKLL